MDRTFANGPSVAARSLSEVVSRILDEAEMNVTWHDSGIPAVKGYLMEIATKLQKT